MLHGTVIRGMGGLYTARTASGDEYVLRCKKKFRRLHMSPMVGDEIDFTPGQQDEHGWLEEILPRKTECLRPPVANVGLLLIVVAPVPEPDLLLVDRLMMRARAQDMDTVLVVNKSELDASLAEKLTHQYACAQTQVFSVSARERAGLDALKERMGSDLCCLTGQSGVGKSTLLNALFDFHLETGEISERIQRGKNTTRHAELLQSGSMRVLDTAGFSLLENDEKLDPVEVKELWPDFAPYEGQCRFAPCYHASEPGCAVTAAVEKGELDAERVARYRQLLDEVRQVWRERYD